MGTKFLIHKPQGKRPFGRYDNVNTDLKEIGYEDVHWIQVDHMIQWRALVNTVLIHLLLQPKKTGNLWNSSVIITLLRKTQCQGRSCLLLLQDVSHQNGLLGQF